MPPAVLQLYPPEGGEPRNPDIDTSWQAWSGEETGHLGWGVYPNRLAPGEHRSLWKFVGLADGRKMAANLDFTLPAPKHLVTPLVAGVAKRYGVRVYWFPARGYSLGDEVVTRDLVPTLEAEGFSASDGSTLLHGGTLRANGRFAIVAISRNLFQTYLATGPLAAVAPVTPKGVR